MSDTQSNDRVIQTLSYDKKVMAEEVLHANAGGTPVKILPSQPEPEVLPPLKEMIQIRHRGCSEIAFYYTHRPQHGEIMTASRARTIGGKPIERGAIMVCGSCGAPCGKMGDLYING